MLEYPITARSSIPSSSDSNPQNSYIVSLKAINNLHFKKKSRHNRTSLSKVIEFLPKKVKISHCVAPKEFVRFFQ